MQRRSEGGVGRLVGQGGAHVLVVLAEFVAVGDLEKDVLVLGRGGAAQQGRRRHRQQQSRHDHSRHSRVRRDRSTWCRGYQAAKKVVKRFAAVPAVRRDVPRIGATVGEGI